MPTYKFTLIDKFGSVDFGTDKVKNWQDLEPNLKRNSKFKGLVSTFTNTFEFVGDIRLRLRDLYDDVNDGGSAAVATLFIYSGNDNGERNSFKQIGDGQEFSANFSEYKNTETTLSLNFEDSSFQNKVITRKKSKINYDIPNNLDGGVMSDYVLDDVILQDRVLELNSRYDFDEVGYPSRTISLQDTYIQLPMSILYNSNPDDVKPAIKTAVSDIKSPELYFYLNAEENTEINLDIDIDFNLSAKLLAPPNRSVSLIFRIADEDKNPSIPDETLVVYDNYQWDVLVTNRYTYSDSRSISIPEGYSVGIFLKFEDPSLSYYDEISVENLGQDQIIFINEVSQFPATNAKCIRPHKLFERITEAITGQKNAFHSTIFGTVEDGYTEDGEWSRLVALNGKMIRQFEFGSFETADGRIISTTFNTSLEDAFDAYNCIEPLALSIETVGGLQRIRIEKYNDIFENEISGDFGDEISGYDTTTIKDVLYTEIKCGYKDQLYEEVNGLDSAHGEMNLSTPLTSTEKTYNIICKWRTGGYDVEIPRREPFSESSTTDTRYDKDNYLIDAYISGTTLLSRQAELFSLVEGILAPEKAYNLRLSPKRNLLRHGGIIKQSLTKNNDDSIIYTKGSNNQELITQLLTESDPVVEKDNVLISDLPNPKVLPDEFSFTAPLSNEEYDIINSNKNKLRTFTDVSGKQYAGYIDDLTYDHPKGEVTITLISAKR